MVARHAHMVKYNPLLFIVFKRAGGEKRGNRHVYRGENRTIRALGDEDSYSSSSFLRSDDHDHFAAGDTAASEFDGTVLSQIAGHRLSMQHYSLFIVAHIVHTI